MPEAVFFSRIHDESLALLIEARDYLLSQAQTDFREIAGVDKNWMVLKIYRVTLCLTQAMAWAMFQRARFTGEMSDQQVEESIVQVLHVYNVGKVSPLTPEMASRDLDVLVDRSQALLERVVRISQNGLTCE